MTGIFKDQSIGSNGRWQNLTDEIFEAFQPIWESSTSEALTNFLRQQVYRDKSDEFLSEKNKKALKEIIEDYPLNKFSKNIEKEIHRLEFLHLKDAKSDDNIRLEIYYEISEMMKSESIEWAINKLWWWVDDYRYYSTKDMIKFQIAKKIFREVDMSDIIQECYLKRFNEASL